MKIWLLFHICLIYILIAHHITIFSHVIGQYPGFAEKLNMSLGRMIFGDSGFSSEKGGSSGNNRELVRKWDRELKKQMRQLDRDMNSML